MKCPRCGSENIEVRFSFILPIDLFMDADGVFRGEVNENIVPDFAGFYCASCHSSGELHEGELFGLDSAAHISMTVEWQPSEDIALRCDESVVH